MRWPRIEEQCVLIGTAVPCITCEGRRVKVMIGGTEIAIILAIAVLLFGARRIAALGRGIGEALRELRDVRDAATEPAKTVVKEVQDEIIETAVGSKPPENRQRHNKAGSP